MTDRERIYTGLSHAAWGYFFLTIDFNLGSVSILPRFVGWLLALSAIGKLSPERRELLLLRPLAILEGLWSGADWLLSWGGGGMEGHILFLDLVIAAVTLYFHFQYLTDLAVLAERFQSLEGDLDRRLRRRRTADALLFTAISLSGTLRDLLPWAGWEPVILGETLAGVLLALTIMANLFELRRCVRE